MKRFRWQVALGVTLVAIAVFFYLLHLVIFRDSYFIFKYVVAQLGFLPISVLLVTLVVNQLLVRREKRALLKKLNMVIGAFYSEVGTQLLHSLCAFALHCREVQADLAGLAAWSDREFAAARGRLAQCDVGMDSQLGDLAELRQFLIGRRGFLLRLLENPNLLEHESFTELLWAVFHLTEELASREQLDRLPGRDYDHLSGDIKRVYGLLLSEWVAYMRHLKDAYPYLFSLAVRTNPFDPVAAPEVV